MKKIITAAVLIALTMAMTVTSFAGSAITSKYIGEAKAKSIALKRAGVAESQASGLKTEFDCDDGMIIYEVEFTAGGVEYEYDIDAKTGKVILSDAEKADGSRKKGSSNKSASNKKVDRDDD